MMSNQSTMTIVLAIRPRLFRELLHHALKTESSRFRVLEATEATPANSMLKEADWLIIDEESTNDLASTIESNSHLAILSLNGRGSRVRVLAPNSQDGWLPALQEPSLSQLLGILSHEVTLQPG